MARMTCRCGNVLSTMQVPNNVEYHVYSDFEWVKFEENDSIEMIDFPSPTYQVWKCPKCERIYVFNWGYGPAIKVYQLERRLKDRVREWYKRLRKNTHCKEVPTP